MKCVNKKHPVFIKLSEKVGESAAETIINSSAAWNSGDIATLADLRDSYGESLKPFVLNLIKLNKKYKGTVYDYNISDDNILGLLNFARIIDTEGKLLGANNIIKDGEIVFENASKYANNIVTLKTFLDDITEKNEIQPIKLEGENVAINTDNNVNDNTLYYPSINPLTGTANSPEFNKLIEVRKLYLTKVLYAAQQKAKVNKDKALANKYSEQINALYEEIGEMSNINTVDEALKYIEKDVKYLEDLIDNAYKKGSTVTDILYMYTIIDNYKTNRDYIAEWLFDEVQKNPTYNYPEFVRFNRIIDRLAIQETHFYDKILFPFGDKYLSDKLEFISGEDVSPLSNLEKVELIKKLYGLTEIGNISNQTQDTTVIRESAQSLAATNNSWGQLVFKEIDQKNIQAKLEYEEFSKIHDDLVKNLEKNKEWKKYLNDFFKSNPDMKRFGVFAPFLQIDDKGNPTGLRVSQFSYKFYTERALMRPKETDWGSKSVSSVNRISKWNNWRGENLILFDARMLFYQEYLNEMPGGITFTQQQIDDHIQLLKDTLGSKYQNYIDRATALFNDYLARYKDLESKATNPADIIEFEVFKEKYSPFIAAERHYNGRGAVTIGGKNFNHTKWKYTVNVPKKTKNGVDTGYYDGAYDKIDSIDDAREYHEFIDEILFEYSSYYPTSFIDDYTSNFIPRFEKGNILGELLVQKEYNKAVNYILDKTVKNRKIVGDVLQITGITKDEDALYDNIPQDVFGNKILLQNTIGLDKVNNMDLYLPRVVKAFALASINYRNKEAIREELMLGELFIKRSSVINKKGNLQKDEPAFRILKSYQAFKEAHYGKFAIDRKLPFRKYKTSEGKTTVITDLTLVNSFNTWMYATTLGWNPKAGMVQFIAGMQYNMIEALGGQFIDIKDLMWGYTYMSPSILKGMYDIFLPVTGVFEKYTKLEKFLPWKIRKIIENYDLIETIALTLKDESGRNNLYTKDDPSYKDKIKDWWRYTVSPHAAFTRADYLNQGALVIAMLRKTQIEITDVLTGNKYTVNAFDIIGDGGSIDIISLKNGNYLLKLNNENITIDSTQKEKIDIAVTKAITKGKELILKTHGNYQNKRAPIPIKRGLSRLVMSYRSWLPEMFQNLYGEETYNANLEDFTAGVFTDWGILGYKAFNPLKAKSNFKNGFGKKTTWSNHKRANFRKSYGLIGMIFLNFAILSVLLRNLGDDDDDPAVVATANIFKKVFDESSFFYFPQSFVSIFKFILPLIPFLVEIGAISWNSISMGLSGEKRLTTYWENGKRVRRPLGGWDYLYIKSTQRLLPGVTSYYKAQQLIKDTKNLK